MGTRPGHFFESNGLNLSIKKINNSVQKFQPGSKQASKSLAGRRIRTEDTNKHKHIRESKLIRKEGPIYSFFCSKLYRVSQKKQNNNYF